MDIKRALPRPELRSVVRSFEERRVELRSEMLTLRVAARPHLILNIHLAEPYRVRSPRRRPGKHYTGNECDRTADRSVEPTFIGQARFMFSIFYFNLTGLSRLVGI